MPQLTAAWACPGGGVLLCLLSSAVKPGVSCVRCAYAASWSWARTTTCAACGAEEPPRTVIRKLNERFTECELGSKMPRELIESGEA